MTRALHCILSLREIVVALGGDLHHGGQSANVPAPGHSQADRSVSLLLDGDRLVIHGFGSADWRAVRAHLLKLGLIDARGRLTGAGAAAVQLPAGPTRPPPHVRIAVAQTIWANALPLADGDLCRRYFRHRGVRLLTTPTDLRRHPAAPVSAFRPTGQACPALIAAIRAPDGAICAVEIAYLDLDGRAARRLRLARKMVGSAPTGVAMRLCPLDAELLVGEGVVTTLSAMARFERPGWAPADGWKSGALVAAPRRSPRADRGRSRQGRRGGGCEAPVAPPGHGHGGRDPCSAGAVWRLERGRGRRPGGEGRAG